MICRFSSRGSIRREKVRTPAPTARRRENRRVDVRLVLAGVSRGATLEMKGNVLDASALMTFFEGGPCEH